MSNPAYLTKLRNAANASIDQDPAIAFMVSWILWEAVRSRLLLLQCKKMGWSLKDAKEVLDQQRISSNKVFKNIFEKISNTKFLGILSHDYLKNDCWHKLAAIEKVRHKVFHAGMNIPPKQLAVYSRFILSYIEANRYDQHGSLAPGDPFAKQKKGTKSCKNRNDLIKLVEERRKNDNTSFELPKPEEIEKVIEKLKNKEFK